MAEFHDSYRTGEWYGEVGTQTNKEIVEASEIIAALGLDTTKKTAAIFPHIFWDATYFWGVDLFDNYEHWFVEVLRVAVLSPDVNWIVKIHPANIVKDARDKVTGEHSEARAIRNHFGKLPDHVKVIPANRSISTFSLLGAIDYCLTVRGTVGIEAACRGITVLTAGTGRYDGRGFTVDSQSKEEYLSRLRNLADLEAPSPDTVAMARKYAFGLLLCRPLRLTSVRMEYAQDANASLSTRFAASSHGELWEARDVQSLCKWINSEQEDYCDLDSLPLNVEEPSDAKTN